MIIISFVCLFFFSFFFFFFNDTATTEIYTLSLHDALPISLAYYAAWAVDDDASEARHAVAMAKAYASDMVKQVTSEAIQLHGGIGFTWEHDMHLYHRRALAQEAAFGSAPVHRAVVAEA